MKIFSKNIPSKIKDDMIFMIIEFVMIMNLVKIAMKIGKISMDFGLFDDRLPITGL